MLKLSGLLLAGSLSIVSLTSLEAGTISGGGGNTLPDDPIGDSVVAPYLRSARSEMYMFFQYLYQDVKNDSAVWRSKLFSGPITIFDVINSSQIWVTKSGACKSETGEAVDASVGKPFKDSICFSPSRLGKKLDKYSFHSEMIALLAHEYSHFLGFNEAEATDLQKTIRKMLTSQVDGHDWYWNTYLYPDYPIRYLQRWLASDLKESQKAAESAIESTANAGVRAWNDLCHDVIRLEFFFNRLLLENMFDMYLLSPAFGLEQSMVQNLKLKILGARMASCRRNESDFSTLEEYIKIFGNNATLTTAKFGSQLPLGQRTDLNAFPNPVSMLRIDSLDHARSELDYVTGRLQQMHDHLSMLTENTVKEF